MEAPQKDRFHRGHPVQRQYRHAVFNQLCGDDLYDEAMANAETDDERADYFESPAWNVSYYNKYIEVLKQQFDVWVEKIDTRIVKDSYFQPQKGDCVLNFNYTTTIEDNFDTYVSDDRQADPLYEK